MARIEVEKKPSASRDVWGWILAIIAILILIWLVAEFAGGPYAGGGAYLFF
jgi:hypothetical protein